MNRARLCVRRWIVVLAGVLPLLLVPVSPARAGGPDSDGDGVNDDDEIAAGTEPMDIDTDDDTIGDSDEFGDNPAMPTDTDGDKLIDARDPDSDADGAPDLIEAGDGAIATPPIDSDDDGDPDYQDIDSDNDGVLDAVDNCRTVPYDDQTDSDADALGDVCDNCPTTFNPGQADLDQNGVGDVCDQLGEPCSRDDECASGHCQGGICCDQACTETCKSCKQAEKQDLGPDGVCGFRLKSYNTAAQCVEGVALSFRCDGVGNIESFDAVPCGDFACTEGACVETCEGPADCAEHAFCDLGACRAKGDIGGFCDGGDQCISGYCNGESCGASPGCGDCGAFSCRDGVCFDSCHSLEECALGNVCVPSGACIPAGQVDLGEGSLACTAPGGPAAGGPWALFVIGASLATARRRSRARRAR